MSRIYNFSAGPAVLPESVLKKAQAELLDYRGSGMSIMEMSHRGGVFEEVIQAAERGFRELLSISDDYAVLFLQGGASLQFSMIPMNLVQNGQSVDVIKTGVWTKKAITEIKRMAPVNVVASSEDRNFSYIPNWSAAHFDPNASFAYITSNNTIAGTQYFSFPNTGAVPLVADMSSDILCRRFDINQFGLVFAGAQKNLGPSGVTVVIIRKDLVERGSDQLPTMLQYRTHVTEGSMYNTPPTFAIYLMRMVLDWIKEQGGLDGIEALNRKKAQLLYDAIDNSAEFYCPVEKESRSLMNVVFRAKNNDEAKEAAFLKLAQSKGLSGLKGHRLVGGLRASIYNAQTLEAVQALVDLLKSNS